MLKSNIEAIIEQLFRLDKIKDQHTEMVVEMKQKVKSWASLCNTNTTTLRLSIDKIIQGKIDNERVR